MGNKCCSTAQDPRLEIGPGGNQNPEELRKKIKRDKKDLKKKQKKGQAPDAEKLLKETRQKDKDMEKESRDSIAQKDNDDKD